MKRAIFLGTILLVLGGFYSACSAEPITLKVKLGNVAGFGQTAQNYRILEFRVKQGNNFLTSGGSANFIPLSTTGHQFNVDPANLVRIDVRAGIWVGTGATMYPDYIPTQFITLPTNLTGNKTYTVDVNMTTLSPARGMITIK